MSLSHTRERRTARLDCLQPKGGWGGPARHPPTTITRSWRLLWSVRLITEAGAEGCRLGRQTEKRQGRLEEFGNAACVPRAAGGDADCEVYPHRALATMRNEALHQGENRTLVTEGQRAWMDPVQRSAGCRPRELRNLACWAVALDVCLERTRVGARSETLEEPGDWRNEFVVMS